MNNRILFVGSAQSKTGVLCKDAALVRAIQSVVKAYREAMQDHQFIEDCHHIDGTLHQDLFRGNEFLLESLMPRGHAWLFKRDRIPYAFTLFSVLMGSKHPPKCDPGDLMDFLIVLCQGMTQILHVRTKLPPITVESESARTLIKTLRRLSVDSLSQCTGWDLMILYSALKTCDLPPEWNHVWCQIHDQTVIYRELFVKLTEVHS